MATKPKTTKKKAANSKSQSTKQPRKKVENLAVMDKIKNENVQMRPSWHFGVLGFALGVTVILLGFFASLLMSAIVDEVRDASDNSIFEFRGSGAIVDFPWLLLVITGLSLVLSYRLIKKLDFSYKHRSYIMFGSLALVLVLGATFFSSIDASRSFRDDGVLQPFSTFSQFAKDKVLRGEVLEISDELLTLDVKGEQYEIMIDREIIDMQKVEPGDSVTLFGLHKDDGDFEAEGLRKSPHKRGVRGIIDRRNR